MRGRSIGHLLALRAISWQSVREARFMLSGAFESGCVLWQH